MLIVSIKRVYLTTNGVQRSIVFFLLYTRDVGYNIIRTRYETPDTITVRGCLR